MKKSLLAIAVFFLVLSLASSGCNMRRPAPKPGPSTPRDMTPGTPAPPQTPGDTSPQTRTAPTSPQPAPKPSAPADTENKKLSDAVKRVEGVKDAVVVISGSTATVGVEMDSDIEDKKTEDVKDEVSKEIKKEDSSIKKVHITTDPNIFTRIEKVGKGIGEGRPVSEFAKELEEISRRITPSEGKS